MKRTSLGVILQGRPECIQKDEPWIFISELICKYGWIVSSVITVIMAILGFSQYNNTILSIALGFLNCSLFGWILSLLWGNKVRCAYCRHFFTLKRISDDQVLSSYQETVSRNAYSDNSGMVFDLSGNMGYYSGTTSHKQYGTKTTTYYTYNVRCSCCGAVTKVKKLQVTKQF